MKRPREAQDLPGRAMEALAAELAIPAELEARLLDAIPEDAVAKAMNALEADLVIPADLEARVLDAVLRDADEPSEASSVRAPSAAVSRPAVKPAPRHFFWAAVASVAIAIAWGGYLGGRPPARDA